MIQQNRPYYPAPQHEPGPFHEPNPQLQPDRQPQTQPLSSDRRSFRTRTGQALRRLKPLTLGAVMLLALSLILTPAHAAAPAVKMAVLVDGQNRSFLPVRFLDGFAGISTGAGADGAITVSQGDKHLTFVRGSLTAQVNGKPAALPAAPFAEQGATYVPAGFLAGQLNLNLTWNSGGTSVTVAAGGDAVALPVVHGIGSLAASQPVTSAERAFKVGSRTYHTRVVTVSLLHPKVRLGVALAQGTVGHVQELKSIAVQNKAVAAINGTFFDAYTKGAYKAPYGYIASGGKLLKNSPGDRRATFVYDANGLAELLPGLDFRGRFDAGVIEGAVQAGPRLVTDGKVSIHVREEGFRDPKILTGGGARSALGITRDHKLLLLTTGGATIPQLAEIMKQAGAYQAMNLDGGASSGLYCNGKYLTAPGRPISNAIIVTLQ